MSIDNSNSTSIFTFDTNSTNSPQDHNNGKYDQEEIFDVEDVYNVNDGCEKVYCFETDHAAIKGNADYHSLIKTLALLEAQRIQTIEHITQLEQLKHKVRENPEFYVSKLLNGDTSDIPARIDVKQVPNIDWSKYSKRKFGESHSSNTEEEIRPPSSIPTTSSLKKVQEKKTVEENVPQTNSMVVRGRAFDQSKPQTFNQLWTAEEQLRLEELLLEFPPETNENNRWRKIAHALGNRTWKQVCSRVQKYFKKLNKAGLPIPGHQLKTSGVRPMKKKFRRRIVKGVKDSTFFPTQHLGAGQLLDNCEESESRPSVAQSLRPQARDELIQKVIQQKKKDEQLPPFSHPGVKCATCSDLPLHGTRWRCLVCPNISLCSDCVLNFDRLSHPSSHPLEPLSNPSCSHWDPDYMPESFQTTNYLDPNFVSTPVLL